MIMLALFGEGWSARVHFREVVAATNVPVRHSGERMMPAIKQLGIAVAVCQ